MIIFLFLTVLIQIPVSDGIMTGMVVTVEVADQKIQVGGFSAVTVKVEYNDGESLTPRDLVEVTLSVTAGTFEPASAITDVHGQCTFTYNAPDEVDGPTDVTITATAENGVLDPTGSDEVTVTYRLEGVIMGPSQVEAGGKSENFILKVTAGGEPVHNVNVMPLVMGAGTLGTYSRATNVTGEAVLTISPGDVTGQISIILQLGSPNYFSSAVSRAVNVVEELAPLELHNINMIGWVSNWGAREMGVRVLRGEDPVQGRQVHFTVDEGYFIEDRISTDAQGYANVTYIASSDTDDEVDRQAKMNVTISDGAEWDSFETTVNISRTGVSIPMRMEVIPYDDVFHGQLFPGEPLIHQPRLFGPTNLPAIPYVADLSLEFELRGPTGEVAHTSIVATGFDTLKEDHGGNLWIHFQEPTEVYRVPNDPIDGNYSWVYNVKSRNGVHEYYEISEFRMGWDTYDDYTISIHSEGKDDWTFIYYFAGANDLAPYMDLELEDLENEAPEGEFKVYVYFDRDDSYDHVTNYNGDRWYGPRIWDLEARRENGIDVEWYNSGDEDVLVEFMKWVSYCSPSGHYCLVLDDHGEGYRGTCWDNNERRDDPIWGSYDMNFMSPDDVRSALSDFKRDRRMVEVVTLAACGMSTIEVATRIAPYTSYMVGSELPLYSRHGLVTDKVLEHLKGYDWATSPPTPFLVATDFVNGFIEESGGTDHDATVCVVDTGYVKDFEISINATMRTIYNNWELLGESFTEAFEQTTRVPGPVLGEFENGDLKEFLIKLRDELSQLVLNPTARSAFNGVQDCLDSLEDMIVYLHSTDDLNGLILYMPMDPIDLDYFGFLYWDYDGISRFHTDYYSHCIKLYNGGEYYPQGGDGQDEEDTFKPLDPVDGYIIDDDGNGLGNRIMINLTPSQDIEQQPAFRVVIDCLQFSGNGGGYLSDMLKKRIVYEKDDFEGLTRIEVALPVSGRYTVMARVLDQNNEVVQKFIVGNYTMEGTQPEGAPPSLEISASETTITVGDEIDLSASISDPDGDDVDVIWDFDHRDGVLFDSGEEEASCRYLRSGNVTVTCIATDGENTVVESLNIIVEPAVGNNAPTAKMTSDVNEHGVVALDAGALSSDPDGDMLLYKFNFGDGNWTDWMEEGEAEHHYKRVGTYNCSVRVMDIRGAGSERYFLLVDVLNVSNQTGGDDDDNGSETGAGVIIIVVIATGALAVIFAMILVLVFLYIRRRRGSDVGEENEDVETW